MAAFLNSYLYILSIGLQVQNRSICQSNFNVEREILDKQSTFKIPGFPLL